MKIFNYSNRITSTIAIHIKRNEKDKSIIYIAISEGRIVVDKKIKLIFYSIIQLPIDVNHLGLLVLK